ncbi:tetratricopeptide repeat protein [Sorangium sp. So ce854]|uniref:tetratricopeptide repeat protein n=1 Tax=Sorangium sp. So ce854 TaxID=3133322 RepID=UPI003F629D67
MPLSTMRFRRQLPLGLLLVLALPAVPATAFSQPARATEQAKAAARALADKAWELFNAGRYEEALAAFQDAEAQVHAPPFLLYAARSCEKLGRLIEARSLYQRIVDEPLAASAPQEFQQAQADARAELAALAPRIPTLEVAVTGAAPGAVELTLDGERVAPAAPVERDPGEHTVSATAPGQAPVTRTIRLSEGSRERVTLDLAPAPVAAAVTVPSSGDAARSAGSDVKTAALIGGGAVAGAGALAGLVFTLVANGKASDARQQRSVVDAMEGGTVNCMFPDGAYQTQQCSKLSALVDDKYLFSNLALWSFIGAGVSAVGTLGYYWLATTPSEPEKQVHLFPLVTPGGGGLVAGGVF